MGVNLKDLILKHQIKLEDLSDKKVAIDGFNILYQFLTTIRQRDGSLLMDSKGNVTSHLSGLFYRTLKFMEAGILPCYVFDGKAPLEKSSTQQSRAETKIDAEKKYKEALDSEDLESARMYAQRTAILTRDMVSESKKLLDAMGIPWVQAVAEGEAQAAYMARKGAVWAVVSQDYDSLLFATPRLIRNLSITGKRKVPKKSTYIEVNPELIDLTEMLNFLQLDISGLIKIALLTGTDYNEGVKGVGPKTALKIIRENKFEEYTAQIPNWQNLYNLFMKPAVTNDYNLVWKEPDLKKIKEILCEVHEFDEERIESALKKILEKKNKGQTTLEF